jgi:hypothetical protein
MGLKVLRFDWWMIGYDLRSSFNRLKSFLGKKFTHVKSSQKVHNS